MPQSNPWFYLISSDLQEQLFPLRLLSLFFSSLALVGITWLWRKNQEVRFGERIGRLGEVREFLSAEPLATKELATRWARVIARLENQDEANLKLAIIEADQLLDEVLKRKGYAGENFAERLQQFDKEKLPNLEGVWEAHQVRNSIVHDQSYHLSFSQARRIIGIYQEALQSLGLV